MTGASVRAEEPAPRDVGARLAEIAAARNVPGLVAVRVDGGKVTARGVAGVRVRGETEPLRMDDRMHLGSCTKAMTATLCAILAADGKLRFDETLGDRFPDRAPKMHDGWKKARLEHFLTNRSGAPESLDEGGIWQLLWAHRGTSREGRLLLLDLLTKRPPRAEPGTKFEYSNAGFSLAGAMAEAATGQEFEPLLRERLFRPLGIRSGGFGAPCRDGRTDAPLGHRADGKPVAPGPGDDNPPTIGPAGTVHMSIEDWAKFASLHASRGARAPKEFGKVDWARLRTPPEASAKDDSRYAMGWISLERPWAKGPGPKDRGEVLMHAGSNTMWHAVAWIAPERDLVLLACSNQGGAAADQACDDAVSALARP
ncbi:MAG: hypothetical protein HMLKMBBP_01232 [Planctomycetes bacterium]|nr:hypothetical protein [Planctomycetota bacterium]